MQLRIARPLNQRGFTLVELAVSTALCGMIVLATMQMLIVYNNTNATNQAISDFQALATLIAGYVGSPSNCLAALVNANPGLTSSGGPVSLNNPAGSVATPFIKVGSNPGPQQNLFGNWQVTSLQLVVTPGAVSTAPYLFQGSLPEFYYAATLNVTAKYINKNAQLLGIGNTSMTDDIPVTLTAVGGTNSVVACSGINSNNFAPIPLPSCVLGTQIFTQYGGVWTCCTINKLQSGGCN